MLADKVEQPYYAGAKVYAITTHLNACKMGGNFMPFSVLLWHDKWLPCTERIYFRHPYAIKTQLKASKMPTEPLIMP